ncbi:hypothetical protein AVEN_266642-1 [Araneus ventricosus]|uniref:Uncharacterized protein n=1 Tax=Araneus ventricosus TaxID=182803 RepID=A0A4Y2KLS4_ARAVE|nr:hypothetical protein AVEN_266642-1 [Araneus ventricosus]
MIRKTAEIVPSLPIPLHTSRRMFDCQGQNQRLPGIRTREILSGTTLRTWNNTILDVAETLSSNRRSLKKLTEALIVNVLRIPLRVKIKSFKRTGVYSLSFEYV